MAKLLDKLIIIDLEATCWEDGNFNRADRQQSEIIEVGVAVFNYSKGEIEANESIIVKPQFSKVSDFCTKLTTLTQNDVDKGVLLDSACAILSEYGANGKRTWASWGDYDHTQLERECKSKQIRFPFGKTHLNIKNLFAVMMNLKQECSVSEALNRIKLDFNGTPHRGVDDSRNIARIYGWLLQKWNK